MTPSTDEARPPGRAELSLAGAARGALAAWNTYIGGIKPGDPVPAAIAMDRLADALAEIAAAQPVNLETTRGRALTSVLRHALIDSQQTGKVTVLAEPGAPPVMIAPAGAGTPAS